MKRPSSIRRQEILNAIIDYLLQHGVAELSLRPLAAVVGSKARLLIYHFQTKDSLVAEAMIVVRDRVQKAFAAVVAQDQSRAPSRIMDAFWNWATSPRHERYLRLFFEVHGLALQKPSSYGRYLEHAVTSWTDMLAAVLPEPIPYSRRRVLATLAVSTVVGLLLDYLSSGNKKRTSDALALFATNFDLLVAKSV